MEGDSLENRSAQAYDPTKALLTKQKPFRLGGDDDFGANDGVTVAVIVLDDLKLSFGAVKQLEPLGYQRVNQDTLKTREKCIQAAKELLSEGLSVAVGEYPPKPSPRPR